MSHGNADLLAQKDLLTLQADPVLFNAALADFVTRLQGVFPHRRDLLIQAQQKMNYLTAVNTGAVMRYFHNTMQPFQADICHEDTGALIVNLPQIQLLQGKITQQDLIDATPEHRVYCAQTLKQLYVLSCGPQNLPQELLEEMDSVVNAITSDEGALSALSDALESMTRGEELDPATMEKLQSVFGQTGLPGLPG